MPSHRDRWARLRHSLWQPPRPHGEQPHERVVGPLELFYDLAVVVLIAQAARRLAGHLDWSGLGQFAVVFTLVWIAWANGSLHYELHGREDARSRITFLVQILVLAVMGACIPAASGARGAAFAVATAVLFAILAGLWLRAGRGDPPSTAGRARLYVAGTAAFAVLMACTALLPAGARVPAWGLLDAAYLVVFGAVILTASAGASLIVTDALIERFGTLTIIVLGEILTSVVAGLASQPLRRAHPQRRAGRRRGRLRRVVDVLRLHRAAPAQAHAAGHSTVDTQPPAPHGHHRCHGGRSSLPH